MCRYRKIDLEQWARKEHYLYYTNSLNVEVNMTANIDASELLTFCHTNGYKFYPTLIYCVTKVLNQIENFKMFKDKNGDLCVWDSLVPNYTIFHEEDHTFSDCWTDFTDDFDSFYKNITYDMELGKTKRGIKVKKGQPANFYCVSCTPWTAFTAVSSRVVNGGAAFFPIITAGKYDEKNQMPVNITIAHAVADGYHIGLFFEYLQKEISKEYLNSNLE